MFNRKQTVQKAKMELKALGIKRTWEIVDEVFKGLGWGIFIVEWIAIAIAFLFSDMDLGFMVIYVQLLKYMRDNKILNDLAKRARDVYDKKPKKERWIISFIKGLWKPISLEVGQIVLLYVNGSENIGLTYFALVISRLVFFRFIKRLKNEVLLRIATKKELVNAVVDMLKIVVNGFIDILLFIFRDLIILLKQIVLMVSLTACHVAEWSPITESPIHSRYALLIMEKMKKNKLVLDERMDNAKGILAIGGLKIPEYC